MSTGPIQRTSVGDAQPWSLVFRSARPVHCPACGIKLPAAAAVVAGQVLVCRPCLTAQPNVVTQAICICFLQQSSELWSYSHGIYAYTPRLGMIRDVRAQAVVDGRWPEHDQPCNYPPYAPDWARHLSAALDQFGGECAGPMEEREAMQKRPAARAALPSRSTP